MKTPTFLLLGWMLTAAVHGADSTGRITPEMQSTLDAQKKVIAGWAANPVLVAAVKAQNAKGPLAGMTNGKWRALKSDDPVVLAFQKNAAGLWLAKKLASSDGLFREAFLSAAQGEKVAFVERPSLYLHAGSEKFDLPMSGRPWAGKPEYDKSSSSHAVQISTPVLDRGKPIGVLVVGVSMKSMKTMTR